MEKLTIKPWQVMQAHENGAEIEMALIGCNKWSNLVDILWNWYMRKYRISNLTADGIRLDELIEKYPDGVRLEKSEYFDGLYKTSELIKTLIAEPSFISEIKVKQEKKLRPWTMAEFEKHRDEWFVSKSGSKRKIIHFNDNTLIPAWYESSVTYKEFMESFNREDGSPCGVIE